MKSKLSKAMYGKSMMKSGGAKKTVAKASSPKMKMGGAKKPLRKAQTGTATSSVAPLKDKNIYAGPINEIESKLMDMAYPSTAGGSPIKNNYDPSPKKGISQWKGTPAAAEAMNRRYDENYLRSNAPDVKTWNQYSNADKNEESYPRTKSYEFKKGGKVSMYKKGGMTKMKTGGMVNSNAKVSALKTAGSKGVKSGVNSKVTASKVAKGRVGGTSTAPKGATPKAKMGGMMKGKKC